MIHLDHAATSFPKAPGVADAVARWYAEVGVSPDRGDGDACRIAAAEVAAARRGVASLCGVVPEQVAFTSGTTESLHLLFTAVLRAGDRVVTTAAEHSSVVRPLVAMRETLGLALDVVPVDATGTVDATRLADAVAAAPCRLLVVTHASNVTGAVQPVGPALTAARAAGALSIVDAAQTIGMVDVPAGTDFVVGSAHKSLLGPPGLGFVAAREPFPLVPPKPGGSGSSTALEAHPDRWPTVLESGTPNTPALFGLAAALRHHHAVDPAAELARALGAIDALAEALLERVPAARLLRPSPGAPRLPILSFVLPDLDPAEAGMLLASAGIQVRTGFHCAPWVHRALGTTQAGTIRVSVGPNVPPTDVLEVATVLAP